MNRQLLLIISTLTCVVSSSCVTARRLDERIGQLTRENARTNAVLEHRVTDLQTQLTDAQRHALEAIQEEALVRGAEAQTLRDRVIESEGLTSAQLESQARARAKLRESIGETLAIVKRDLSARIDVEAMAHVEEHRQILEDAAGIKQAVDEQRERLATSRQQDRDQVTAAIARLDRNIADQMETGQEERQVALAKLSDEMHGSYEELTSAIADTRRAIDEAGNALYAELEESHDALLAKLFEEENQRRAQAQATARLLEQRRLTAAARLADLGEQLARMQQRLDATRLARKSDSGRTTTTIATPPTGQPQDATTSPALAVP